MGHSETAGNGSMDAFKMHCSSIDLWMVLSLWGFMDNAFLMGIYGQRFSYGDLWTTLFLWGFMVQFYSDLELRRPAWIRLIL
jgi:hypothetical protein